MEIWSHGGTAQYAAELAQGLYQAKGELDEVHLIVPLNFVPAATENDLGPQTHKILPELHGFRFGGKIGSVIGLNWLRWRQIVSACQEIRKIHPDAVHILSISIASRRVFQQIKRSKAKSIVTVHDLPQQSGGVAQAFYRFWCRHFTLADHLIVHGPWSLSQIEARSGQDVASRTDVMPLGLYDYGKQSAGREELRSRFGVPTDGSVMLFFGSMRRNKGLHVLIEALAESQAHSVHVLVAGQRPSQSEPPIEWYQNLASELGVSDKITWLIRRIENEEVADLFACSDVVVLPYTRTFAAQSSVLSVAAACDVPVIASDVGDIGSTVKQYKLGKCLPPESSHHLATFIRDLDLNQVDWGQRKTREFAEDANWTNIGRRLWSLYRDVSHR